MLSWQVSESHGNIIVFPGVSNQTQAFDLDRASGLDAAMGVIQRAVYFQQATADTGSQSAPSPTQPHEPQPVERAEWWFAVSQGMGSPENFQPTGTAASQAAPGSRFKFFIAQPLSWVCCGEKPILPDAPSRTVSKIPIC